MPYINIDPNDDRDESPEWGEDERCGDIDREEVAHLLDDDDRDPDELDGILSWGATEPSYGW